MQMKAVNRSFGQGLQSEVTLSKALLQFRYLDI